LGATAVPWADVARQAGLTFAAVWLAVALQTWVAVRWPSFTVATGIGVAGTLVGFILGIAHASAYVAQYVPWTAPYFAVARGGEDQPVALALGIGGGVLVSILGAWDTNRREIF
jgi:hypothetical protein